ncbi:MAG: phenylalanine--tRNA ligase subunit beta, partial [Lentisphaerae bacterium]|nr:phenylalanine--tRNA ligase subunit beta [Lentisphaerota bacterium]
MKVPVSWLKEYVDFDVTTQELANRLTFSGIEVENISRIGSGCEGVIVGEILSFEPHPDAARLRLCRVNNGAEELHVVCGADNFTVGDKVALAGIGTDLPNGTKIRKAKIRGQVSEGMLCAEDELGLSSDHSGIMILPQKTSAGTPLVDVIGPPDDVLEVEITWNRADCLSMIGIAREIAALFGSSLRLPKTDINEEGIPVADMADVRVEAPELCPRYTARVMTDVKVAPSPMWMQRRLSMCGVRPISNIVDITNYVLLECGHPLHAFDYDLLSGHKIVVRRAKNGERMTTLDGEERLLT